MTRLSNPESLFGTVLLTGASGFVGSAVLSIAKDYGIKVRPVYRSKNLANLHSDSVFISSLDDSTGLTEAMIGVDVVIHAAARAHVMRDEVIDPLNEYRRVNVDGTLSLARHAAIAGVRRFVFISSIKVNGEATLPDFPFTADDPPAPVDAYGISKAEAEAQLKLLSLETGMEVTIIRPPLIYGPFVKGNFASLISLVRKRLPLPLGGATKNLRSLVGLDNLVDLILVCARHPNAANQTFLVSDGVDLSTADLLRKIGDLLGRPVLLLWVPPGLIHFMARLFGKTQISQRLLGSLQVDIKKNVDLLDWTPSVGIDEALKRVLENCNDKNF